MEIRLSLGSATHLGLRKMKIDVAPTTLYTMLGENCYGRCAFCTQARDNMADKKYLSRIVWPKYDIESVVQQLRKTTDINRICIQTLNNPDILEQLPIVVEKLHSDLEKPISVCMNPVSKSYLIRLKNAGVERVGTGLDCATQKCFNLIKPGFHWEQYQQFIQDTIEVFGRGSVHLIVGLGDSDEELINAFQNYTDMGCSIGLFALTPMPGTKLHHPAPSISRYRSLQLARFLISRKYLTIADMDFIEGKLSKIKTSPEIIDKTLSKGVPFHTSGCPDCNRPNYNERPRGLLYNYAQPLEQKDLIQAIDDLKTYITVETAYKM